MQKYKIVEPRWPPLGNDNLITKLYIRSSIKTVKFVRLGQLFHQNKLKIKMVLRLRNKQRYLRVPRAIIFHFGEHLFEKGLIASEIRIKS